MYKTLSANRASFNFSFQIWMPFISFSYLPALAKTSCIMLNRHGEDGHSCLIPELRRKVFSFSPLSITHVSCGFFIDGLSTSFF